MHQANFLGLKLAGSHPPFSHLFYADDVLIMAEATTGQALQTIIQTYCDLSGQERKSRLVVSKRAPAVLKDSLREALAVDLADELGSYLGVPVTSGVPRLYHFDSLRGKMKVKLSSWKARTEPAESA